MDRLNCQAYAYHYRNIDSTAVLAMRAYTLAKGYGAGRAEALNNLAFVDIVRMQYDQAEKRLDEVSKLTGNQIELLIGYVQQMRLCQRRSHNREFHEYRELADRAMRRISEERTLLTDRDRRRLLYAETEYAIVNSTYYYYVGLERQSVSALMAIDMNEVRQDTAQYLNYLYNIGSGGIITQGTQQDISQQEYDHLMHCLQLARQGHYPYFIANAQEALSEHLDSDDTVGDRNAFQLAEDALHLFIEYGDVYQIAGAYRTLASCYRQVGDNDSALINLEQALSDQAIFQAPDLVASIYEQLSVAYAAIDDKPQSDMNRNLYLDLQETTRQDRQLEARASQYERIVSQLNTMLVAVVVAILLLLFSLWLFNRMNKRENREAVPDDLFEQKGEKLAACLLRIENSERRNLEQRAKLSMANSILPFIDRIIHEVGKGGDEGYVMELIDQINDYNDILTHWIQLRQGELSIHVESFSLQPLLDMVARSRTAFQMKGVDLQVLPTDAVVKADRVLTLFMLNTLADNARKYTGRGGTVIINAIESEQYVEMSVTDNGCGMTSVQLDHLFDMKPLRNEDVKAPTDKQYSHGFGLLNCKGIIEKYRKTSQIFNVCMISAESEKDKGTRIWFRLPKGGVVRALACWTFTVCMATTAMAGQSARISGTGNKDIVKAAAYADSSYFSNINGTYERTLMFADSCRYYLNHHYRSLKPQGRQLMLDLGNPSLTPPEISWYHDSLNFDYHVILDMRNESAVAALALHKWPLYAYNNRIYTQLFKEMSADNGLGAYCRMMQQTQQNKTIAVILLVLVLLSIVPAYYLLYYRHRLYYRFQKERQRLTDLELLDDELRRAEYEDNNLHVVNAVLDNCLSALKHETMYYPSRIRQLLDNGDKSSLNEVLGYYRELYGQLCLQAMRQAEHTKLHLSPLKYGILGDETLIRWLYEIFRKQSGHKTLNVEVTHSDQLYTELRIPMPGLTLTEQEARELFTPSKDHIPWLLCRQIIRDHGEASNRRGCGIRAEHSDGQVYIIIVLPSSKEKK